MLSHRAKQLFNDSVETLVWLIRHGVLLIWLGMFGRDGLGFKLAFRQYPAGSSHCVLVAKETKIHNPTLYRPWVYETSGRKYL